jgi:hypothetical protein
MPDTESSDNQLSETEANRGAPHNEETGGKGNRPQKKFCNAHRLRCVEIIFAGVLVLVGIAYTVFAALQWGAMRGQVAVMNNQLGEMEQSSRAGTDAAKAASSSVDLTRESTRLDQRAWISIPKIEGKPTIDQPLWINVTAKNTGKTPAIKFLLVGEIEVKEISKADPDFAAELQKIRDKKPTYFAIGGVLGPAEENTQTLKYRPYMDNPLQKKDVETVQAPTEEIYAFGEATYADIFGCDHSIRFCVRLNKDGRFEQYGSFNGIDYYTCK